MHILVVYDISDDSTRTKVADICGDYGLDRIQYSVFQGELQRVHQEELMDRIQKRLSKRPGKISLYQVCARDWDNRIEILQDRDPVEKKEPTDAAGE